MQDAEKFLKRLLESNSQGLFPTYAGLPTFMRMPFYQNPSELDIALVGVAFDGGVTSRPGARHGPREIRNQSSLLGFQNHQSHIIPYIDCCVGDVGDVPITQFYNLEEAIQEIELFYKNLKKEQVIPITAGGDHSISFPILKALGAEQPVALIHIDAHCDTAPEIRGSKFQHGSPFHNAVEAGVLDPKRTIQIGIRGPSEFHWDFSYSSGMCVIHIEEFRELGLKAVIEKARAIVGDAPTYISFDIDAIDPAFAPGTGTPEVGGLTSFEGQQLIRGMQGLNLIGADIVEVSPPWDPGYCTALLGATLMFELLCVVSEAFRNRKA